jgi:hypothetical protein
MKYFTHPQGKFVIKIPIEWQYRNEAVGHGEISPFSFELYENPVGAFQISCYSAEEKQLPPGYNNHPYNTPDLQFVKKRMDGGGFNVHLWYAIVQDHALMVKYIYETVKKDDTVIKEELEKVDAALKTLQLLSPANRPVAIEVDRYEKFIASLAASFDLKTLAMEKESFIECLVIIANQIDAYLRMALVLNKQLQDRTDRIDISLLYQGENDPPVMEKKIYKQARAANIIDDTLLASLEQLYLERNKIIHRYIISPIKTRAFYRVIADYEKVCEAVRRCLAHQENLQFEQGFGMHSTKTPGQQPEDEDLRLLHAQINDKHLIRDLNRKIAESKNDN